MKTSAILKENTSCPFFAVTCSLFTLPPPHRALSTLPKDFNTPGPGHSGLDQGRFISRHVMAA
ncbi:MAG: hypothetical protein LBS57_06380, partial [Treponema sp.]|nr:hypothetical protein [Treponema sp.]